jgi:hypothetical protein
MLIYDLADPQELQGFVRGIQEEEDRNRFVLSQFLPNRNIDDIEYRVTLGQLQDQDVAVYRAWDTEAPIGSRQGLERLMGELPPLSKKIRLGEEERLRRRSLERNGDVTEIVNAIYDDAANLARSIAGRVELARGEMLFTGKMEIDENGVSQTVDFQRRDDHTVTAGTLWSTLSATAIQHEQAWLTKYKADNNGLLPALALGSQAIIDKLLLNEQYRAMAPVNGVTPPFLSLPGINQIRAAYSLPPIVPYDVMVRIDGVQTRVTPENQLLYLPPASEPLGATLFGTTAESLELVGASQISQDQAPGMTVVVEKTFDPVATWTKCAAIALPTMPNPDLTLVATVL